MKLIFIFINCLIKIKLIEFKILKIMYTKVIITFLKVDWKFSKKYKNLLKNINIILSVLLFF